MRLATVGIRRVHTCSPSGRGVRWPVPRRASMAARTPRTRPGCPRRGGQSGHGALGFWGQPRETFLRVGNASVMAV